MCLFGVLLSLEVVLMLFAESVSIQLVYMLCLSVAFVLHVRIVCGCIVLSFDVFV